MIRTKTAPLSLAILALSFFAAAPAPAHHSGAMFDPDNPRTIRGRVKTFEWTNPHSRIVLVTDSDGADGGQIWTIEMTSPGRLSRDGWTKRTLSPGDHIEVKIAPAKSEGLFGNMMSVKNLATGTVMSRNN